MASPRTHYGSWDKYRADSDRTVEQTVREFVGGDVANYDVDALTEAYRAMINLELPTEIALDSDQFYGPEPIPADAGRTAIEAAIEAVDLDDLVTLYDRASTPRVVQVYEDNSGAVYLGPEDNSYGWAVGPVTLDLAGRAEVDAHGWHFGDWRPAEDLKPACVDELPIIATWNAERGLYSVAREDIGAGGARYLGIEL